MIITLRRSIITRFAVYMLVRIMTNNHQKKRRQRPEGA